MASALFVPADDQKNHQKHDGNCGIRSDGGGEQPAEQKARITVAARIVVVIIAAVVAAPAASAVAVVIEVADVCARAHRADRCKNDRAQHQCREKNTNRFFHCFDHRFRKGKASFLAEF